MDPKAFYWYVLFIIAAMENLTRVSGIIIMLLESPEFFGKQVITLSLWTNSKCIEC